MERATRPDPQSRYYGAWVIREKKRKKEKRRRNIMKVLLVFLFAVFVACMVMIVSHFVWNFQKDVLFGQWMYDQATGYEFDGNGEGNLIASEKRYAFRYQIGQDMLTINFKDDNLEDLTYQMSVESTALTLVNSVSGQELVLNYSSA